MPLIFCLVDILTQFRPSTVKTSPCFVPSLSVSSRNRATLTGIYQAVRPKVGYGSLVKFLSRGKWDSDAVAQRLIKLLQQRFDNYVYVYDETRAIKTGEKQFGLHFFRNHRYQKRNTNQSKFHFGHQFGALGLLCTTVDSVSGVGEPDMSQESGQQWVGTEADLLPNPAWTDYL